MHDAGKETADRVLWVDTRNLSSDPEHAWFEMFATARDQAELKRQAGKDARGRKNAKPVLHYTLSWATSDSPTPGHMLETALSSLKALKLDGHQALMAAHGDKDHLHVHIVVNTIHPDTGLTAQLKYSKEHLSRWAEAYEREHGIHCDERIKNNEERKKHKERKLHANAALMHSEPPRSQEKLPYVPVKHRAPNRKEWFERKELADRMKRLRAEMDVGHKIVRNATWDRQRQERAALGTDMKAAIRQAKAYLSKQFKPHWRNLYSTQRRELKFLERAPLLERAVFVFVNKERLANGRKLSLRQIASLIRNPGKLLDQIEITHQRERSWLAQMQKTEARVHTGKILDDYAFKRDALVSRQTDERQEERTAQFAKSRTLTLEHAKASLRYERLPIVEAALSPRAIHRDLIDPPQVQMAEPEVFHEVKNNIGDLPPIAEAFREAADPAPPSTEPQLSRSEQIKREMAEWRKRNEGKDFGREM